MATLKGPTAKKVGFGLAIVGVLVVAYFMHQPASHDSTLMQPVAAQQSAPTSTPIPQDQQPHSADVQRQMQEQQRQQQAEPAHQGGYLIDLYQMPLEPPPIKPGGEMRMPDRRRPLINTPPEQRRYNIPPSYPDEWYRPDPRRYQEQEPPRQRKSREPERRQEDPENRQMSVT
jgi:hypothetical protein